MRDCPDAEIRDVLPEFARGTMTEPARSAVAAHVDGCEACRDEVAVLRAVRTAFPAPSVDVRRIVAALPASPGVRNTDAPVQPGVVSLDAHRSARRPKLAMGGWRRAAAVAAVMLGGSVAYGTLRDGGAGDLATIARDTPAVADDTVQRPGPVDAPDRTVAASAPANIGLGGVAADLTTEELEVVLASLEEFDGVLAQEPHDAAYSLAMEDESR